MKDENNLHYIDTSETIRNNFSYFVDLAFHHNAHIDITRRGKIVAKIVPSDYDFRDIRRK